jgi:hypothetical protein
LSIRIPVPGRRNESFVPDGIPEPRFIRKFLGENPFSNVIHLPVERFGTLFPFKETHEVFHKIHDTFKKPVAINRKGKGHPNITEKIRVRARWHPSGKVLPFPAKGIQVHGSLQEIIRVKGGPFISGELDREEKVVKPPVLGSEPLPFLLELLEGPKIISVPFRFPGEELLEMDRADPSLSVRGQVQPDQTVLVAPLDDPNRKVHINLKDILEPIKVLDEVGRVFGGP